MAKTGESQWYKSWFNSPYYHILYQHRDEAEASAFVAKLQQHLNLPKNAKVFDLACGKGRFAVHLAKLGYNVTGLDLSEENIAAAQQNNQLPNLQFVQADMRKIIAPLHFDLILNLFTSFGYFETDKENNEVLQAISTQLKPNGIFVLDFINKEMAIHNLEENESIKRKGIEFNIQKNFDGAFLTKSISFSANGIAYSFQERVKAYSKKELTKMLEQNQLMAKEVFGSYQLSPFNEKESNRLVLIAEKG